MCVSVCECECVGGGGGGGGGGWVAEIGEKSHCITYSWFIVLSSSIQ